MKERDWMLLNAYADRELEAAEMEILSARLRREPALAAELDRIRALKAGLAGIRSACAHRPGPALASNSQPAILAFAAALLLAGLIGLAAIERPTSMDPAQPDLVLSLHSDFSARSYPEQAVASVAQAGEIAPPDLSGSNLRLVDSRRRRVAEAVGYHYRGPRGCRVTLVVGTPLDLPAGIALAHRWTIGERTLVLIADGMDPQRFAAIADYAESATRNGRPGDQLRIALEERTAAARPCA